MEPLYEILMRPARKMTGGRPSRSWIAVAVFWSGTFGAQAQTITIQSVTPNPACQGANVTVTFDTLGFGSTAATFVAQLSAANGTFPATPYTIATGSGSPLTGALQPAAFGPGYRIRVRRSTIPLVADTIALPITQAPAATIDYPNSPYCNVPGTAPVTRTGTPGGTYAASPAGLVIDPNTGAVNLGTSTPGTYTVTYTVAAGAGCPQFQVSTTITISSPPAAGTIGGTDSVCINGTTQLTVSGASGPGTWSSSLLVSVDQTGLVTGVTAGQAVIRFVVIGPPGCVNDTALFLVTVNPLPATPTTGGPYSPVCVHASSITLGGTLGGVWSGPGVTGPPFVFNPTTAGAGPHTLTITVTSPQGCQRSNATTITVNPRPVAQSSGGGARCENGPPVTVTWAFTTGTVPFTYAINNGASLNTSGSSVTISVPPPADPGSYDYSMTALTDGNGCIGTSLGLVRTVTNLITPDPPLVGTLDDLGQLCNGQYSALFILNHSEQPPGTTYSWANGPYSADTIHAQHWNTPGSGTLTVRARNFVQGTECADASSYAFTVSQEAASCPKGIVFFEPYGLALVDPPAGFFQWGDLQFGNGAVGFTPIAGETDQTIFRTQWAQLAGNLPAYPPAVVRSSVDGTSCFSHTVDWLTDAMLDRACLRSEVDDKAEAPEHTIYPNPLDIKVLTIENVGRPLEETLQWELFDLHGRSVRSGQMVVQPVGRLVNGLEGLDSGVYLLNLRSSESNENFKLILN